MKILLISGHGANDPGACSSFGVERDEARKIVNRMVELLKAYEVEVDVYPQYRNCYADVCNGAVQVNMADYDYVFEIHFNSASSPQANGVEIWVTPIEATVVVERNIVNKLAAIGFQNRGVKKEYFAVITHAKNKGTSSALVETCFISNQNDMNRYKNNFNNVCNAMVSGIVESFKIEKKPGVEIPKNNPDSKPSNPAPAPTQTTSYTVKVINQAIYVIDRPSPDANIVCTVYKNDVFTIVDAQNGYGKLKSGAGWINLKYTIPTSSAKTQTFKVKIVNDAIYVIDGPSPDANIVQTVFKNEVYTIVGVDNGYGKLKSGAGWINLKYTTEV